MPILKILLVLLCNLYLPFTLLAQDDPMYPKTRTTGEIPAYEHPDEESRVMGYISLDDKYTVLSNGEEFIEIRTDRFRAYISKADLKQAREEPKPAAKALPNTEQEFRSQVLQQPGDGSPVNKDYFRQIANIRTSKLVILGALTAFNLLSINNDVDPQALTIANVAGGFTFLILEMSEISKYRKLSE